MKKKLVLKSGSGANMLIATGLDIDGDNQLIFMEDFGNNRVQIV